MATDIDLGQVVMLKGGANNPATKPALTDELVASVNRKADEVHALLSAAASEFGAGNITFANSFGAEDMVLTDIILNHAASGSALGIEIFSLDTGRLPVETYDLMATTEKHYNTKLKVFFPSADKVETYVNKNGINAFYESIDLRKACCFMRKVEPLQRALKGKIAWITGMRAEQSATRVNLPVREFDSG
ncbi:MAG TPA: phosphoadenosine phosphosulfate reductase family protein, partial [Methylotenera sp.]|nr:phosphoadenosine phosphosulfate reductase family protein [Methylotenera sp.]